MLFLTAALLLVAAPLPASTGQDYARQAGARLVGKRVPPLRLRTMEGATIDLAALRGRKAVYLKFWATWCGPCREQMPHFQDVHRRARDDLQVIAVNIGFDDTDAQIAAFRRQHGLTMPIVRDGDGELGELFGLRVTPQHVVIDREGIVRHVGHLADAALEAALSDARKPASGIAPRPLESASARKETRSTLALGDGVPGARVRTLEGFDVPLADPSRQRTTVLAFLSPWCESYFERTRPQSSRQCRAVREQLVALGRDRRVRWLGIASGLWAGEEDLRDYRNAHAIPVPLGMDNDDVLFRQFGVRSVPVVIVVDARGRIVHRWEPANPGAGDLHTFLRSILPAAAAVRAGVQRGPGR